MKLNSLHHPINETDWHAIQDRAKKEAGKAVIAGSCRGLTALSKGYYEVYSKQ